MKRHNRVGTLMMGLGIALGLAACGGGGTSGTTSGGTGGGGPDVSLAAKDLEGTWETQCYTRGKTRLTFTDGKLTGTYTTYAEDACSIEAKVLTWTATISGGNDAKVKGAKELDVSFTSFKAKPVIKTSADADNQDMYCGKTDWAAGVEQDVLGKECGAFSIPEGGESLDIYHLEGTVLTFGKDAKIGAGLAEADRPTEIDENRTFTKQ